jgi:hypothetical protein
LSALIAMSAAAVRLDEGGVEGRGAAAPQPGGTARPPKAAESAVATLTSYLPVPIGTNLLGLAAFQAALKLCTALPTGVLTIAPDAQ